MTTNHSSNATQRYVFLPVDLRVRIAFWSVIGICGVYGLVSNSIILYLTRQQERKRKRNDKRKPFNRFLVTNTFVQSLALSDLLCSSITIPIAICINFVDFIDTDLKCKAVRFSTLFLPIVTMNNLFIIGMERYCAIFHPFRVPSLRKVKIFVVAAWGLGIVSTSMLSATFRLDRYDVSPERFTLDCVYDNTVPVYKAMFIATCVVFYFIPAIALSITNIRIMLYFKRKEKRVKMSAQKRKCESTRSYGASTFASLIVAFILPFVLSVSVNLVARTVLRLDITFTTHYITGRVGAALMYSNASISPTILLSTMPHLRKMFKALVLNYFPGKDSISIKSTFLKNDAQVLKSLEVRRLKTNGTDLGNQICINQPDQHESQEIEAAVS